ncbi:MAG: YdeI/OmpD-associated family protein [Oscillospiraceae bacterium]|nr:YdeI/OmpD-associated family protein [Oscillospiraceae bacterium]
MKTDVPELLFPTRADFRAWLIENAETSEGVWLIFGKAKASTLSAVEALEEALCFGWIDGQMKSIDETKYRKYFARRRAKSVWSDKNKKLVDALRSKGIMTELGENAVETAKKNGTWDAPKGNPIADEQIAAFAGKLIGISPAYENFCNMPPSVQRTYTMRYLSFKTDEARERDFAKIVDRLNNNLKPM